LRLSRALGAFRFQGSIRFKQLEYLDCMVVCRVALFSPSAASDSGGGPAPRCHHGVTVADGKMYIVGGEDGEGVFDDVWVFDLSTSSWQEIIPVNPHDFSGRQGCTCCVVDNKLFVIGGGDLLTNHIGAVLDLQSLQWTDLRLHGVLGHKPDGRQHHASAVVSDCIVVHGGFNGIQHLGDTWLLDARSFTWRQLHKSDPAPASSNHTLVLLDDRTLLRIGGEASSHATTVVSQPVVISTQDEGSWVPRCITGLPPQPVPLPHLSFLHCKIVTPCACVRLLRRLVVCCRRHQAAVSVWGLGRGCCRVQVHHCRPHILGCCRRCSQVPASS
jgi:hypothetical protein